MGYLVAIAIGVRAIGLLTLYWSLWDRESYNSKVPPL